MDKGEPEPKAIEARPAERAQPHGPLHDPHQTAPHEGWSARRPEPRPRRRPAPLMRLSDRLGRFEHVGAPLANGAARLVQVIGSMAVVPVLLSALGREAFAVWMAITSLTMAVAFLDLGLGGALVNRLSASGETPHENGRAVSSCVVGLAFFWGAAAIVLIVLYPHLAWDRMFGLAPGAEARAGPPAAIMLLSLCAMAPACLVGRIRLGVGESHVQSLWDAVSAVVALVAMLLVASLGGGVTMVVLAHAASAMIVLAASWAQLLRARRWLMPRWRDASYSEFAGLLRQGGVFFSIGVCNAIAFGTDSLIAVSVFGASAATEPMIALRLASSLQALMAGMVLPYWPRLSRVALGSATARNRTLRETFAFILLISVMASVGLLLLGPTIVRLWTGGAVDLPATLALPIAVWVLVYGLAQGLVTAFSVEHLVKTQLTITAVSGVLILICKIGGAVLYGPAGFVWGGVAALLFGMVVPLTFLLAREVRRHDR